MLYSFWGKFDQWENQNQTSLITNHLIHLNTVDPMNDDTVIINWEQSEDPTKFYQQLMFWLLL